MKQLCLDNNSMVHHGSIKRLIYFVHNLEEKLSSVKRIHDKLYELMSNVAKTHETIVDELASIKTVLFSTYIYYCNGNLLITCSTLAFKVHIVYLSTEKYIFFFV